MAKGKNVLQVLALRKSSDFQTGLALQNFLGCQALWLPWEALQHPPTPTFLKTPIPPSMGFWALRPPRAATQSLPHCEGGGDIHREVVVFPAREKKHLVAVDSGNKTKPQKGSLLCNHSQPKNNKGCLNKD